MYCTSCGAKSAADSNFCRQCGVRLDKLAAPRVTEEAFDRALPEDEKVTALLERAYRSRKENDLPGAIALCEEVLTFRPESTTAHGLLGQLYEQNGQREKAVEQYERVLQLNPGSIADRVKLDELRDGARAVPPRRVPTRQRMLADPNEAPLRTAMLWGAGISLVLIISGAALAVVLSRRDGDRGRELDLTDRGQKGSIGSERSVGLIGNDPGSVKQVVQNGAQPPAAGGALPQSSVGFFPTYGFPMPQVQYSGPPVGYPPPGSYQPGYPQRQAAVPPATVAGPARKPNRNVATVERMPNGDADGERIHLTVGDGGSAGDGRRPGINVVPKDEGGRTHLQSSEEHGIQKVTAYKGPLDPGAATAATSESMAFIAVGQDKLNRMDYAAAIQAFGKALSGANDESAYVYKELAVCYQNRRENRNAVAMFERAREEYRKLIAAGRQLDKTAEGIRQCETGIKICSSE